MTDSPKTIERNFEVDPGGERYELTPDLRGGLTQKLSKEAGAKFDIEDVTHQVVYEDTGRLVKVEVSGRVVPRSA